MATIKKSELREFFDKKFEQKENEIKKELDDLITKSVEPYIQKYSAPQIDEIEKLSKELANKLEYIKNTFKLSNEYFINYLSHYISNIRELVKNNIKNKVKRLLNGENYDIIKAKESGHYTEELIEISKELIKKSKLYYNKIEQLHELHKEIKLVINNERTGEKAYKRLIELGVDMSEFKPSQPSQLPAVIKLSVDVDLINN
jgi:hypothetical protein